MYHLREFRANARRYGVRAAFQTLVWNVRFGVGYRIGGFTDARRSF
jgi:hypothetical protein